MPRDSRKSNVNLQRCFAALICLVATASALAQPYPSKPIRLVVPFPPGGGTDIFARQIATKLSESLGWVVVVDNKPGAGGNIGVDIAAKSPADGYTVVLGQTSNLAINPTLYGKLPYDPLKDLVPVVGVAAAPVVLVVAANSPYTSLADVVAAARAKPGAIMYASPGNGTVSHLAGERLQRAAGVRFEHIPYKGSSQAMTDVIGGNVALFMASVPSALAQINGGKLRAIAVTSDRRIAQLPDVPTVAESGYKDFEATTWYGLLVPSGTPPAVVETLNREVNRVLQLPEVRAQIAAEGGEPLGGTPEKFASLMRSEYALWGRVVKESGAKAD
jgi:tripartite-type tricarboxylate transporter receptor subunit TctC